MYQACYIHKQIHEPDMIILTFCQLLSKALQIWIALVSFLAPSPGQPHFQLLLSVAAFPYCKRNTSWPSCAGRYEFILPQYRNIPNGVSLTPSVGMMSAIQKRSSSAVDSHSQDVYYNAKQHTFKHKAFLYSFSFMRSSIPSWAIDIQLVR